MRWMRATPASDESRPSDAGADRGGGVPVIVSRRKRPQHSVADPRLAVARIMREGYSKIHNVYGTSAKLSIVLHHTASLTTRDQSLSLWSPKNAMMLARALAGCGPCQHR